jgi:hypothetical protein
LRDFVDAYSKDPNESLIDSGTETLSAEATRFYDAVDTPPLEARVLGRRFSLLLQRFKQGDETQLTWLLALFDVLINREPDHTYAQAARTFCAAGKKVSDAA